ncbi:peptidoglycan-binding protein [Salipaludibacillus sp. HK11]|uniref:peptidoglycan-binding protein n=1 Tax=Salipaludibacillus sp. HK11 TaxID=3394320 RepID=UPI0039FBD38A
MVEKKLHKLLFVGFLIFTLMFSSLDSVLANSESEAANNDENTNIVEEEEENELNKEDDSDVSEELTQDEIDMGETEDSLESEKKNSTDVKEPTDDLSDDEIPSENNDGESSENNSEVDSEGKDSEDETEELETKVMNASINSGFELGDSHEKIIELKEGLNQIGFGYITVTENFGNFTETQVRAFQDYYGLSVTGVADEATFEKLDSILDHPYQKGKSNSDLAGFKVKLNWMDYGQILVTENFGSWMESRVKAFQRDHNLAVSGIIEPVTEAKINETFASIFKVNNRHASIVDLKEMLNQTSFGGILVSDLYGSFTSTRVRQFQEYYELEVTGEANVQTLNKLESVLDTPFREGVRHPDTIELKEGLNLLGFGPILVSDLYGSFTKRQVASFQETYGLSPTGVANDATWAMMNELLDSPLQEGRNHEDLIELKQKLNWTGYGHILVTENYGSWMASRIRSFQQDHDLPVNGIIDEKTQLAIEHTFEKGFTEGNRNPGVIDMKEGLNKLGFGNILVSDLYGSFTAQQVRSFQEYYGLEATGKANLPTLNKIDSLLNSSLQEGKRHNDLLNIKDQMNNIGFGYITVTTLFGSYTEQKVKELQDYYGLRVNGILDKPTQAKINEVFTSPFREGERHDGSIDLKNDLNALGFGNILVSTLYGSYTKQKVEDFQRYYGLVVNGIADEPTFAKIDELKNSSFQLGKRHENTKILKESLNRLGYGNISVTTLFGSFTEKRVKDFQADHGLAVNGIADEPTWELVNQLVASLNSSTHGIVTASNLNIRKAPTANSERVGQLSANTVVQIIHQESNGWYKVAFDGGIGYVSGTYITEATGPLAGKTVILDAGHGGRDSGGIGGGMLEKDFALDVSLRAEKLLREAGASVIMTRTTDVFLTLDERAAIANTSGADAFVSVHANIFNGSANGTETFWYGRHEARNSERLAHAMQNATLAKMGTHNRGVFSHRAFVVIAKTEIPSALLEVGFMDHAGDATKLRSSSYRDRSAEAIRDGFINYFR